MRPARSRSSVNGAHGDVIDFVSPSGTLLRTGSTSMDGFLLSQPAASPR